MVLTALALASGAAGEEGNATDEALLIWVKPPSLMVEDIWSSTYIFGIIINNSTQNLTVELDAHTGPGFEIVSQGNMTYELSAFKTSGYVDTFTFDLNVSAGTLAPANATVILSFEITAWEGNTAPNPRIYNRTIEIRYESRQPPLEIILLNATTRIDVSPPPWNGHTGCIDYQIYNPSAILLTNVNVHFVNSSYGNPDRSISMVPGETQNMSSCFMAQSRTPAGSYQVQMVAEVTDYNGEASYLSASRNFTVEILPYSAPYITREYYSTDVGLVQNQPFRYLFTIANNGNADDELYLTLANYNALKRDGFHFDPLPGPIALAPHTTTYVYLMGTAPDLFYKDVNYEFVIVVNGSYTGFNATTTQNVRVAITPNLPAAPFSAATLVLVVMASGLRARRGSG